MTLGQVSPNVNVSELDKTNAAPPVSTSTGAFVGNFRWGPVNEVQTVVSEVDLARQFAAPDAVNAVDFHTAAQFLRYSNDLRVVREIDSSAVNAVGGSSTSTVIKNQDDYESQAFATNATFGMFMAKYPGALGNSLKVSVFGFKTDASTTLTNFGSWAYSSYFDGPVATSAHAAANGSSNDEIHVAVIDEDGAFTGVAGKILEIFPYLSQASDAKAADGSSLYFRSVINANSKYIWFGAIDDTNLPNGGSASTGAVDYAVLPASGVIDDSLANGVDSAALGTAEFATGWDKFNDSDTVDVSLLIAPNFPIGSGVTIANDIIAIAEARKDCVAFISPESDDDTASEIKAFADQLTASSYAFVDSGRLKVYDKYNDAYINVPACSSVAGVCAETDRQVGPWNSPAGLRRGQILGITKLYYNPSKADRDTLYKASVNSIVTFPGEGTLLFGDKTKLGRPSAFDRINVRRLFITLEKSVAQAARGVLFELNNNFTRADFVGVVEPVLRNVQGRGGITAYNVVADESNNTGDVIDRNEFVADIYIQPSRTINFIQLNFVATRTGIEFNTVAGG